MRASFHLVLFRWVLSIDMSEVTSTSKCRHVWAPVGKFGRADLLFGVLLGTLVLLTPISTIAEVVVAGQADALQLEANDTTVDEVLAHLGTQFNVTYRRSAVLDQSITGTYKGSLRQVISRLLNGYNFFMKVSAAQIEVVVLGPVDRDAAPGGMAAPTPTVKLPMAQPLRRSFR